MSLLRSNKRTVHTKVVCYLIFPITDVNIFVPHNKTLLARSKRKDPIYGSNRTGCHLNCVKTNDLYQTELFEIELLNDLTVCKQMTDA